MKTFKKLIKDYLEREPLFRERKNKDRGIVNLLIEEYPSLSGIDKKILIDIVRSYGSMDRCWRKVLEEREDLRGSDYGLKEILEQQVQVDLGYAIKIHD